MQKSARAASLAMQQVARDHHFPELAKMMSGSMGDRMTGYTTCLEFLVRLKEKLTPRREFVGLVT